MSNLYIANDALTELGQDEILSLDNIEDRSVGRRVMASNMQRSIDYVVPLYPFSCITKRYILTAVAGENLTEFPHKFLLPSDYGVLWRFSNAARTLVYKKGWTIEGRHVYSKFSDMVIHYNHSVSSEEASVLRNHVRALVSARLVWKTCLRLGKNTDEQKLYRKNFFEQLSLAKSIEMKESPHLEWLSNTWMDARESYQVI